MIDGNKIFDFTIYVADLNTTEKCIEDRLYESGCNDVFLCSVNNNFYLEFKREAENLQIAVLSAIENIQLAECKCTQILVENEVYILLEKIRFIDGNLNQKPNLVASRDGNADNIFGGSV